MAAGICDIRLRSGCADGFKLKDERERAAADAARARLERAYISLTVQALLAAGYDSHALAAKHKLETPFLNRE